MQTQDRITLDEPETYIGKRLPNLYAGAFSEKRIVVRELTDDGSAVIVWLLEDGTVDEQMGETVGSFGESSALRQAAEVYNMRLGDEPAAEPERRPVFADIDHVQALAELVAARNRTLVAYRRIVATSNRFAVAIEGPHLAYTALVDLDSDEPGLTQVEQSASMLRHRPGFPGYQQAVGEALAIRQAAELAR